MTTLERDTKRLEALLKQPVELPHLERLMRVLQTGQVKGPNAQAAALEAVRGELMVWLRELESQHSALEGLARQQEAAALEAQHALRTVMALLEAAWGLLGGGASPQALDRLRQLAANTEAALTSAAARISTSTAGLTLKPLACQPVSRSGVRLKPVSPARRASTPLPAFKAHPFTRS